MTEINQYSKKTSNLMVDNLDGIFKEVVTFLQNNKNVCEPLSNFAAAVSLFRFDTQYNHRNKKIFIHRSDEFQTYPYPCKPCERKISFDRRNHSVVISITSQADNETMNEKSLILTENEDGNKLGVLNRNVGNDTYETYTFGISRNGNVQTRTIKRTFVGAAPSKVNKDKTNPDGEGK